MDLLDQSIIAELPVKQRQAVCRQIRQRQVKKYAEFEKSDKGRELEPRRRNKRGTNVKFPSQFLMQDAVDSFNDRELYKYLYSGLDVNYVTGNGTSLLHRCASEDNVTAAQILLTNGADLEITDDDWWTPLHTACSCDSVEVLQLLLKNKANVEALDVDGYYPVDLTSEGSESKTLIVQHQESLGITSDVLHQQRQRRPQELLDHIKGMSLADDINALINEGVTLLHIAAANGYKSCIKLLFKYNADVNKKDNSGWTPLHVAARYNQTKAVELLLKRKANPNITDSLGCKPSAVTSSDELRGLLMRYERRFVEKMDAESGPLHDRRKVGPGVPATEENVYEEILDVEDAYEDIDLGRDKDSIRLNSKTVRAKRSSISKEDGWMEAKTMYEAIEDMEQKEGPRTAATTIHPLVAVGGTDDEDREGDYISNAIWRAGAQDQLKGDLAACMPSDDLVTMTTITEDAILHELETRYRSKQIYTYIGGVLIAVNPFQELQYYTKDISMKYHQSENNSPLPPHIYGIAENSYTRMMRDKMSQCHVISGESGSGKTESCKHMVQHLLRVAGSEEANLNSKINQVNPLLEAFGNATTMMNLNSSRFGKYVELTFAGDGKVLGGTICQYLLEKSRVVHQGAGECNFHIFYWMMAGLLPEEALVYKLQKMETFRYLSGKTRESMSAATLAENKAKFWEVKECLKFIGFSPTDIQNLLLSLSIVLHLGEIRFTHVGNNEAAQVSNLPTLQKVSEMLEVPAEELGSALVADYTVTRGEQIKKERTVYQAEDCRDALAKSLYARLFAWIVNGINQLIQPQEQNSNFQQIGILDIFGFENFQKNSFEQICINVTNEQIQCYTNDNIFYNEQQDCLLEGVPLVELSYTNNLEIIDLFLGRKMSIFTILDEECSFPKATDKSLATKLHQQFGKKQNKYYSAPKDGGLSFQIAHYAGSVTYDVRGMLEKNRDTLPNSVLSTMKASSSFLLKELFQSRVSRTGSIMPSARQQRSRRSSKKSTSPFDFFKKLRGRKEEKKPLKSGISVERKGPSTVAFHFRNSLNELLPKLQASNPHFIKCIKPNTSRAALTFDPAYVAKQLKYTGISDVVRIRKFGYVTRLTFHEFFNRYDFLTKCSLPHFCPMGDEAKCRRVMNYYLIKGAQFGKTKLFLRLEVIVQLDVATTAIQRKVLLSQAATRGFLARRRIKKLALEREKRIQQHQQAWANKGLDGNKNEQQLKKFEIDKITQELGTLDDVIDSFSAANAAAIDDDDDLYDDAFSIPPRNIGSADDVTSVGPQTASTADADDMNGHLQRGLPPTPTHGHHIDTSRPPPCPREMYSQGMYACIDGPEDHEYRRQAPPPPRRNPETRLSTASVSSTNSATYEELPVEDQYHHHHQHHQQQQQRHTTHGSPHMRSKFTHEPQSPSHPSGNRPFSYGATPGMSQQQKPANVNHANGHSSHQHHNVLPNYQYTENHTASPAASYGKQESVFHPQPHRPPPHGPPPPPPQSPKMQRHSIPNLEGSPQRQRAQMSPLVGRKLSQRSQSVPSAEGQAHLPSPPTHLKEGYSSGGDPYRPESPPLPPPPPEMLANSYILPPEFTSNVPPSYHGHQSNQSLPATQSYQHQAPGPVSSAQPMPGQQYQQQYQQYHQQYQQQQHQKQQQHQQFSQEPQGRSSSTPPAPPPITSIPKKEASATPPTVLKKGGNSNGAGRGSNSPAHSSREPSPSTTDLIGELGKIQLKKTGLKPAPEEEATPPPPEPRPETPPVQQEETTPPPEEDKVPVVSPREFVNMFEKKAEMASKGDTSKNSKMEIDIDDIDLNDVPGFTPITKATPVWKRDMIEKKNQEKIEEYIRMRQKERDEADKWKNVPAWKRKLMMEKEKEKESKSADDAKQKKLDIPDGDYLMAYRKERADEEANKKRRAREAEELKRQKIREQQEYERQMEEELKDVPAWKREIMMKKGGAIKNWGDERAEINDQDGEEDLDGLSDGTETGVLPPPPDLQQQHQQQQQQQQQQHQHQQQNTPQKPHHQQHIKQIHKPAPPSPVLQPKQPPPQPTKQQSKQQSNKKLQPQQQQQQPQPKQQPKQPPPTQAKQTPPLPKKQKPQPKQQPPQPKQQPPQPKQQPPQPKQQPPQPKQNQQIHPPHKQFLYSDPEQDFAPKVFVQKATLILQPEESPQTQIKPTQTKEASPAGRSTEEQKLEEEWESLPEWKKEIIMKKGGTIRNWGDEREEKNEEVDH